MKYIRRFREKELIEYLDDKTEYKNVLIMEGARQVGKSRLITEVLKRRSEKVIDLNLEVSPKDCRNIDQCQDFEEFNNYIETTFNITAEEDFILYIDEAQESYMLGRFVRSMKEQWRFGSVLLTGSSMSRLFREDVRYPVGRIQRIMLRPFSFMEFLSAAGKDILSQKIENPESVTRMNHGSLLELCDLYFSTGGMPAVLTAYFNKNKDVREDTLADIEADFYRLFGEEQLEAVEKCLRAVANITGSPFKNTVVYGNSLSTPKNEQVNSILKRLEDWHIILKS